MNLVTFPIIITLIATSHEYLMQTQTESCKPKLYLSSFLEPQEVGDKNMSIAVW